MERRVLGQPSRGHRTNCGGALCAWRAAACCRLTITEAWLRGLLPKSPVRRRTASAVGTVSPLASSSQAGWGFAEEVEPRWRHRTGRRRAGGSHIVLERRRRDGWGNVGEATGGPFQTGNPRSPPRSCSERGPSSGASRPRTTQGIDARLTRSLTAQTLPDGATSSEERHRRRQRPKCAALGHRIADRPPLAAARRAPAAPQTEAGAPGTAGSAVSLTTGGTAPAK